MQWRSRDSSVAQRWATGWIIGGSNPGRGAWSFSLQHCIHIGSGARPPSHPMSTRGSFPGGKAGGREADLSPLPSDEVQE
jgi:hypothetical protein